jgi:hypothetical protein
LKPILQSLLRRHGAQADAYGDWDVVAIYRKGRRRRDADATFAALLGEVFGAGRRMSPEIFSTGVTIDVSPSLQ